MQGQHCFYQCLPSGKAARQCYHTRIIIALCIPALHVTAALFFFLGLQGFKEQLKQAYSLIATSIVLFGLCLLLSPIVTIFNLWDSWFMNYGIPNILFFIPVIVLTVALSVFFTSLNIASIWRKWWFNTLFIATFILVVVFSPHKVSSLPEVTYDIGNSMFALSSVFLLTLGVKMLIIRRHLTEAYAKVITWLAVGMLTESLLVGSSVIVKGLGLEARSLANLQDLLLLTALPYLRAGYLFYQLTADTRLVVSTRNASAVDVVVYVGSLASNAQAISPIMDGLRRVTSHSQRAQLSSTDQEQLAKVYLQLEDYLEQQEQQRSFTKQQLRELIHQKFKSTQAPSTDVVFWGHIPRPPTQTTTP